MALSLRKSILVVASLAPAASASEPAGITRCTSGAANITRKAFAVQICNLFGGKCFVNHPSISDCATEALEIAHEECKLYPIFEYADNGVRSGDSAVEHLSSVGDLGCSVSLSSSNGVATAKYSGACVSVQCETGGDPMTYAGPGMTKGSSSSNRATGITDTSTATFESLTMASLPNAADQLKNVFLYRTGDYVATTSMSSSSSNGVAVSRGELPTSDGNNYGPVACPGTNNELTSSVATAISAQNLRMCGSTGKWVYYNAINLLRDESLYASYSGDTAAANDINIGSVAFLDGRSAYRSGDAMAAARRVILHSGSSASDAALLTSGVITPRADGASTGETAGTWRNYGVVFYCSDYARTDLTTCSEANQKMFYVADPNPDEQFGSTVSGGGGSSGDASSAPAGAQAQAWMVIASLATLMTAAQN